MPVSLLETFRVLASFEPPRVDLRTAPWESYVDWAITQGLAPLAAYNLEYRLAGGRAPEWARDRLLSVYQGSLNDNVMKLVNFKRAIGDLEGRRILLLGAASFAEALYPHVAFRPVADLRLLVRPEDAAALAGYLGRSEFRPVPDAHDPVGATRVLSDGRTQVYIHGPLLSPKHARVEHGVLERALPMRVYGPSVFRPAPEDAALLACIELARCGFEVPMIQFLDLRELITGSASTGGPYDRALDAGVLQALARDIGLERALFCAMAIVGRLFPEVSQAAARLAPELPRTSRELLERTVVRPIAALGRVRTVRGLDRLRRLLSGSA